MLQVLIVAVVLAGSNAALQFASYYQDHMVLQRGPQRAVIWGHATKIGDTVTVAVVGHGSATGSVFRDSAGHGMWKVKLPVMTAKGPFTVSARSSEGTVTITDVLFGDVWLCGGQSNMEFPLGHVFNSTAEIAASLKYGDIRIMRVGNHQSTTPFTEFQANGISVKWTRPTKGAVTYFSAVCWFFGENIQADRKYPIGLIESNWGGTPIEAWSSPDALSACSHHRKRGPVAHSVLWNPMIKPLLGLTIYGAIWYQGENNAWRPEPYSCQFQALINDWRHKFNKESLGETSATFPFGFVQLAAYRQSATTIGGFPGLRWAQTANHGTVPNQDLKNVFMAVAMDLPDFSSPYGSIHPRYKQDVARRLVLAARGVAYHEQWVHYQGPYPKTVTDNTAHHTINIIYNYGPIRVNSNNGFEVCCSADATCGPLDTWIAAPIQSHQDNQVVLSTTSCNRKVVGVRYAWRESPCDYKKCAIYGKDTSLPAPPFLHTNNFGSGPIIG
ncbi:sialate O-acetylesterase-like [Haliotis rufescens]|uniref:sialate O-acetylesterase-like n=1 Tax=Haliotis rufescens TaxID=6454 RepID=UPI00201FAF8A|nr:sialate O-acetylesterase-like [Haliotis rufescens]